MLMPSSEAWGSGAQTGKYPVKIYTIDGVLIYQDDIGGDNTAKLPLGGVVVQRSVASSMLDAIANPIIYYGSNGAVINQAGHSKDLYNYYWTSYSRGTDGMHNNTSWHNAYLDGYIPLRVKSIYDPCPYLYRIPSNGTWNQFTSNPGWTTWSYLGGVSWNMNTLGESWFSGLGRRAERSSVFVETGHRGFFRYSTISGNFLGYMLEFNSTSNMYISHMNWSHDQGSSVRCIEGSIFLLSTRMPWSRS